MVDFVFICICKLFEWMSITSKDLKITIPETIVSETTNTPETIDRQEKYILQTMML